MSFVSWDWQRVQTGCWVTKHWVRLSSRLQTLSLDLARGLVGELGELAEWQRGQEGPRAVSPWELAVVARQSAFGQ